MRARNNLQLILFFAVLTVVTTWVVIFAWERALRRPFYAWVERRYTDRSLQYNIEQRVEHFFISTTVDVVVVTLLLRLVDRQQRTIRRTEARYRAVFENATDGMVILTPDQTILDANRRFGQLLGRSPEELTGLRLTEVINIYGDDKSFSILSPILDGRISGEMDLNIETAGGTYLPVSITSGFLGMDEERLALVILRDRSERDRLERDKEVMQRQLFQKSKLVSIGELSAGVAHEINNPLNCILNFAQLLKDDSPDLDPGARQMVSGIIEEGDRMTKIVRNLLTFARRDSHETSRIDVAETINNSMSLFGKQLEHDGIKVELDLDPCLPAVIGDGPKLRQVIVNMISNARNALREKEGDDKLFRITAKIGPTRSTPMIRLAFYDNGTGIREEDLEKVFDPFFTTRRDSGGTGLGLSLAFGIAHEFGGNISVTSEEGHYTVFTVDIPCAAQELYDESAAGG
ncbi:MAG TPA: ATP-binding protein [Blastocatellia bacterium]